MPRGRPATEAMSESNSANPGRECHYSESLAPETSVVVPPSKSGAKSFLSTATSAKQTWNTDRLGLRLSMDAASALSSAALICPIITIIDRAIIEKAAKGLPIRRSIAPSLTTLVTRPHRFFFSVPFALIYTLYSSTYMTANTIDTITSTLENRQFTSVSAGPAKFVATTAVNMTLCVYKDSRFARIFGPNNPPSPQPTSAASSRCPSTPASTLRVPKISLGLFCLRDSLTIFASFNLPPLLAPRIPDSFASTPSSKATLAQLSIPASVQIFSTPLHLLGLDLYNRQPAGGLPPSERWSRVRRDWLPSCAARMGRIIPAYGIGGVLNIRLRERLMGSLERRRIQENVGIVSG